MKRAPGAVAGIALALLAATGAAVGAAAGRERSAAIYPEQKLPIAFNHQVHLAAGADCVSCHDAARKSTRTADWNLPAHPECEVCHDLAAAAEGKPTDPRSDCQVCHPGFDQTAQKAPPRIELPPANLRFDHKVHVDRKVECTVCHEGVPNAALATRMELPKMATCLRCHDGRTASGDCSTCHLTQARGGPLQLAFPSGLLKPMAGNPQGMDHGPRFELNHGTRAATQRATCMACHGEAECQRCHDALQKPLLVHPNDFITTHPAFVRGNILKCDSCHRFQSFCAACHERAGIGMDADPALLARNLRVHPDPAEWIQGTGPRSHGVAASRDLRQCIACHREESCGRCHRGTGQYSGDDLLAPGKMGTNPHPDGFAQACRWVASRSLRACLRCHAQDKLAEKGCL